MTEHSARYHSTRECEERGKLYTECLKLLAQINRSPYALKLLIGARDALRMYAGYKANRTHRNSTDADVVTQSMTHK